MNKNKDRYLVVKLCNPDEPEGAYQETSITASTLDFAIAAANRMNSRFDRLYPEEKMPYIAVPNPDWKEEA